MAIRYLYPIPAPIYVPPQLPPGFVIDDELKARLEASAASFEDVVKALGNHQIFSRVKGQEQWDAVLLALDEQRGRREADPEAPDYFAITGAALEVLKTCVNEPVFFFNVDGQPCWQRSLPWLADQVRAYRPFLDLITRGAKDKKPEPAKKPEAAAPEPVADPVVQDALRAVP